LKEGRKVKKREKQKNGGVNNEKVGQNCGNWEIKRRGGAFIQRGETDNFPEENRRTRSVY
jgi:hypothetical protein